MKATLLSLVMAVVLMLPMSLLAQKSDGCFKSSNNDVYNNRDTDGIILGMTLGNPTTEDPTSEAPLGSGLLIMVAAGAGYALARRKKAVREGATMILALGIVFGMTQCKKNTVAPVSPASNGFNITVNANYGGDKTTFDPSGTFSWNGTEYINVSGKKSGYLGVLSGINGTFSGILSDPAADEEELYFFYLGNGNHENATTLDFSNQDGSIGNVTDYHIAIGKADYAGETNYNTTLAMAMAIASFDLSGFTNSSDEPETVYVHGDDVYATATIDYNSGTISGGTKGYIKAGSASNSIYVALIPSVSSETTVKFDSNSKTGSMTFRNGIQASKYYSNSGNALAPTQGTLPEGATPGLFTVAGEEVNGNKISTRMVRFSKGNLQYQASSGSWRFAPTQYTSIGNAAGNNVFDDNRETQKAWIDLFGWGTSGWSETNVTNTNYQPWACDGTISSSYGYGYGLKVVSGYTTSYKQSLTGNYANADWGVYNAIGNDVAGTWRVPTGGSNAEWDYLITTRNASKVNNTENARYGKVNVNDVNCMVLFPDSYIHPISKYPSNINITSYNSTYTSITTEEFESMQTAGAVIIPCNGYRSYKYSDNTPEYTTNYGYYWTSTATNSNGSANVFSGGHGVNSTATSAKRNGGFVRLVYDVK